MFGIIGAVAGSWLRKAWPYIAAVVGVLAAVAAVFKRGESAGRDAERVERQEERIAREEKVDAAQEKMLDAASRRPGDRDGLARKLRDGSF